MILSNDTIKITPYQYRDLYGCHKSYVHKKLLRGEKLPYVLGVERVGKKYLLTIPANLTQEDLLKCRKRFKSDKKEKTIEVSIFNWKLYRDGVL